jgi:hypothetical protein
MHQFHGCRIVAGADPSQEVGKIGVFDHRAVAVWRTSRFCEFDGSEIYLDSPCVFRTDGDRYSSDSAPMHSTIGRGLLRGDKSIARSFGPRATPASAADGNFSLPPLLRPPGRAGRCPDQFNGPARS